MAYKIYTCQLCGATQSRCNRRTINAVKYTVCHPCGMAYDSKIRSRRSKLGQNKTVRRALFSKYDCCQKCGTKEKLTIDHIIPVSMGGSDELSNLTVLCDTCNKSKGAR